MSELLCRCQMNYKSGFWYVLKCKVVKPMPDGKRLKVAVLSDRYGNECKPHFAYVAKERVRNYNESPTDGR